MRHVLSIGDARPAGFYIFRVVQKPLSDRGQARALVESFNPTPQTRNVWRAVQETINMKGCTCRFASLDLKAY